MIHRMDPPEDPGYEPFPSDLTPMLAHAGPLPRDEQRYGFEVKWDGIRALVLRRPRPLGAAGPQLHRLHAALPRAARAGARPRLAPGGARRRGGRLRRGRPPELRAAADAHAPRLRRAGQTAHEGHAGHLRDLRPALPRGPLHAAAALRAAARAARAARARTARPGARRPTTAARAARCWPPRASTGSRAWSPSGSTARTSPGRRASGWIKVKNVARPGRRDRRLDARRGQPQRLARRADGGRDEGRRARLRGQGRHRLHRARR